MANAEIKFNLGFSLLRKLCRGANENFVFSPLSLGTALSMLTAGLRGDTKTELLQLFGTTDESTLHALYSGLVTRDDLPLKIANKYLADRDCEINQQFDSFLRTKYESEVECVSFTENSGEVEVNVNAWVAKKTNNMIPQLLPAGSLNKDTILVLLNAIYFKGSWLKEFDPVFGLRSFRLRSGEIVQRSFITKSSDSFGYNETDKLRVVTIPYKEQEFYMLVAIPKNENEHIDEVLGSTEATDLIRAAKGSYANLTVNLSMPKFRIEHTFERVEDNLAELGVRKIFVPGAGDFGNLFVKTKDHPSVGAIVHKAVIDVDEKGTEAAAATAIFSFGCAPRQAPPPVVVDLNRPFCFLIMSPDDVVCFAGICADPAAK